MPANHYDQTFYISITRHSIEAAKHILPLIGSWLKPQSVVDVGCGRGAWLSYWQNQGVKDVLGIDGDYVDKTQLMIPAASFESKNLQHEFSFERKYDLAMCIEVGEHLPPESSKALVASLARASDFVLFSAATPGQGGVGHINEQSYQYWRELFSEQQFEVYDCIRPEVRNKESVQPWYKYNMFLYVNKKSKAILPESILKTGVPSGQKLLDSAPVSWKMRKWFFRKTPVLVVTAFAQIKHACARPLRSFVG